MVEHIKYLTNWNYLIEFYAFVVGYGVRHWLMISNYFLPRKTVGWKSAQFLILKLFKQIVWNYVLDKDGKPTSAYLKRKFIVLPRVLAGILWKLPDGRIVIPEVLRPYRVWYYRDYILFY
jgi:hypothetical protein